jgi:hypothetical protein
MAQLHTHTHMNEDKEASTISRHRQCNGLSEFRSLNVPLNSDRALSSVKTFSVAVFACLIFKFVSLEVS